MEKIGAFTDRTTDTGEWRPGNPATGQKATPMLADWFNMVQRELVNVVENSGLKLDINDNNQLAAAISAAVKKANDNASKRLAKSANLGDLDNKAEARNNLDLSDAATTEVMTSSTDSSIGRLVKIVSNEGFFGLGNTRSPETNDCNKVDANGFYRLSSDTPNAWPGQVSGDGLLQLSWDSNYRHQIGVSRGDGGSLWYRSSRNGTFSAWQQAATIGALDDHRTSGDHDSRYLRKDANSTLRTNAHTTLTISADDAHNATLAVHGDAQGTGRVYVGQDTGYGGGIEFNGNGSPYTTGAGNDRVTLFRRAEGVDHWTARNPYSSNVWEFREAPTVGGKRLLHTGDSIIPRGLITLWSGAINAVPGGWALCDGNNDTPDLRDRFIVGAGSSYKPGDKGGASSIKLTTGQLPAHNHSMGSAGAHSHSASTGSAGSHNHSASTGSAGSHSHTGSTNTTGNHTHSYTSALGSGTRGDFDGDGGHGGQQTSSAGAHSHSVSINSGGAHTHTVSVASATAHTHSVSVASSGAHTHSIGNTGSGTAHENRPPYYALAYIMKL